MAGLHLDLRDAAARAGLPLAVGRAVPWLSGRGHLNEVVAEQAPPEVIAALAEIHSALGGDPAALAAKRPGSPLAPDLIHAEIGGIIEVDEVQHFTSARLRSLEFYPPSVQVGFDVGDYRGLIAKWRAKGDRAFAHRVSVDFPKPGGRQAQRAYNDALRDLLAPTFTGLPVIRIGLPERWTASALVTLDRAIARFWPAAPQ